MVARSFGPANARSSAPDAMSHTSSDAVGGESGDQVTMKRSDGEKSRSFTPSCPNLESFFHEGPPHRMMPRRW